MTLAARQILLYTVYTELLTGVSLKGKTNYIAIIKVFANL